MNTAVREAPPFKVDREWIAWLEKNLVLGVPAPAIVEAMKGRGCSQETAKALVDAFSLRSRQCEDGGSLRLAKARWLLESLRRRFPSMISKAAFLAMAVASLTLGFALLGFDAVPPPTMAAAVGRRFAAARVSR